jgi:hypothetical protein
MTDTTRRQTLRAGWRLAAGLASMSVPGATRALGAAPTASPQVRFMAPEAAANALSRTPGDRYYANMGLLEIRARMNSPLAGMSLADARLAVRVYDAAAVLPFTDEECMAIRGVIERMHPLLAARAPLYARHGPSSSWTIARRVACRTRAGRTSCCPGRSSTST